jgi:hypothetical protein
LEVEDVDTAASDNEDDAGKEIEDCVVGDRVANVGIRNGVDNIGAAAPSFRGDKTSPAEDDEADGFDDAGPAADGNSADPVTTAEMLFTVMLRAVNKLSANLPSKPCVCASLAKPAPTNPVFSSLPPLDFGRCIAPPPAPLPPPTTPMAPTPPPAIPAKLTTSSSLTIPVTSPFFRCPRRIKFVVAFERCCCGDGGCGCGCGCCWSSCDACSSNAAMRLRRDVRCRQHVGVDVDLFCSDSSILDNSGAEAGFLRWPYTMSHNFKVGRINYFDICRVAGEKSGGLKNLGFINVIRHSIDL